MMSGTANDSEIDRTDAGWVVQVTINSLAR